MASEEEIAALVSRAAKRNNVDPETLEALLALEDAFPDFTIPGERTKFGRKVTEILDADDIGMLDYWRGLDGRQRKAVLELFTALRL